MFNIECIYLTYFLFIFRLKKSPPSTILAFTLTGLSSLINANIIGADLSFFFTGGLLYFAIVTYPRYKSLGTMYVRTILSKVEAVTYFTIIFLLSCIAKITVLAIMGNDIDLASITISFCINTILFIIMVLCI